MATSEATLKMILLGVDRGATRMMHNAGNEASRTSGKMAKFGKVGKYAAAGVAAGLVAAAGAAVEFGRKSIDAYRDAAKESSMLSRYTGLTIKQASQLRFAAQETGTEFKTLSTSVRIFSKNLAATDGNSKKSAALVKLLGVHFKAANGQLLPMSKLLPKVADRFKKMPDGPQKTALAMKLFGKSGADMLKLLNQGGDGLKKFAEEADKTGNSLSNVDGFKKQMAAQREFHASISGLKIQLGQALYPALTAISETLATKVGPSITKLLPDVRKFGEWIKVHVVPAIKELATKWLTGVSKAFAEIKPHLKELQPYWVAFSTVLTKVLLPALGKLYSVVFPAVGLALTGLVIGLGAVAKAGIWLWNHALQPTFKFITKGIGTILAALSNMFGALSHVPKMGWAKGVARDLRNAANAANDVASNINKIPNHKRVTFSLNISAKDRLLLQNPTASPVLKSLLSGHVATGGWIGQSGVYDVGEVGRERVFLPRGSQVQSMASGQREAAQMSGAKVGQPVGVTINFNGLVGDPRAVVRQIQGAFREAGITSGTAVLV